MQRLGFTTCALLVGALVLVPPTMAKDNYLPTAGPNQLLELSGQPALSEQRVERLAQTRDHRKRTLGPAVVAPPAAVVAPPAAAKPTTVRGNQLIAKPGYILEKGSNNQISARRVGGAPGASFTSLNCSCDVIFGGLCKDIISDDKTNAVCVIDPNNSCSGTCVWSRPKSAGGLIIQ